MLSDIVYDLDEIFRLRNLRSLENHVLEYLGINAVTKSRAAEN